MTSLLRVEANRINAAKSTGPRTPRGKALSRLNAMRHGINSCQPVLMRGESRAKWDKFAAAIVRELEPVGPMEALWAGRIAMLQWRLLRCVDARQVLATQQWREAPMAAPQTAWWQHRSKEERGLPASPEEHRRQTRENRRLQTLLERVVAFAAAPTPVERSFRRPPPERRVAGTAAMALLQVAADLLEAGPVVSEDATGKCHCPGLGTVDGAAEAAGSSWDISTLHEALTARSEAGASTRSTS